MYLQTDKTIKIRYQFIPVNERVLVLTFQNCDNPLHVLSRVADITPALEDPVPKTLLGWKSWGFS